MLTYLDTCILIYWVEGPAPFDTRVRTHVGALEVAGHRFAVSEFTYLECLVKPLGLGDGALLLDYERLFLAPNVTFVPLSMPVSDERSAFGWISQHEDRRTSVTARLRRTLA